MKLSVVVPVYNVERYINKCIESVLSQRITNHVIELILVDDGSSDSSGEICDYYSTIDNRVVVLHQSNHGQAYARNRGVEVATGDYIVFLDSDDYWNDGIIQMILDSIKDEKPDMAMYSVDSHYEDKVSKPFFRVLSSDGMLKKDSKMVLKAILENDYSFGWCPFFYIIKNDIARSTRFPEGFLCEDVLYSISLWLKANTVLLFNTVLYSYRRDNTRSTTHIASFKFSLDLLTMISKSMILIRDYKTEECLRDYLFLNYLCLIEVVLFFLGDYSTSEKKQLIERIKELNILYRFKLIRNRNIHLKEKLTIVLLNIFGIGFVGKIWKIKKSIFRHNASQ